MYSLPNLHCICGMLDQGLSSGEFSGQMVSGIIGRWIAFVRLLELITVQGCLPLNEMKCCFLQNNHCPVTSQQVSHLQLSQPALKRNSRICLVIQFRFIINHNNANSSCISGLPAPKVIPQQLLSILQSSISEELIQCLFSSWAMNSWLL